MQTSTVKLVKLTAQAKEIVFNYYSMSLDLDIAILKAGLNPDQITMLYDDTEFMARIQLEDAEVQTEIVTTLRSLMESSNEAIKLKAVLKFAEVHYKKRFSPSKYDRADDLLTERPVNIILKGVAPAAKA